MDRQGQNVKERKIKKNWKIHPQKFFLLTFFFFVVVLFIVAVIGIKKGCDKLIVG